MVHTHCVSCRAFLKIKICVCVLRINMFHVVANSLRHITCPNLFLPCKLWRRIPEPFVGGWDGDPDSQIVAAGRPASWAGDIFKMTAHDKYPGI